MNLDAGYWWAYPQCAFVRHLKTKGFFRGVQFSTSQLTNSHQLSAYQIPIRSIFFLRAFVRSGLAVLEVRQRSWDHLVSVSLRPLFDLLFKTPRLHFQIRLDLTFEITWLNWPSWKHSKNIKCYKTLASSHHLDQSYIGIDGIDVAHCMSWVLNSTGQAERAAWTCRVPVCRFAGFVGEAPFGGFQTSWKFLEFLVEVQPLQT